MVVFEKSKQLTVKLLGIGEYFTCFIDHNLADSKNEHNRQNTILIREGCKL